MAYKGFQRSLTSSVALVGAGAIAFASLPVLQTADEVVVTPRVVAAEVEPVVFSSLQILAEGLAATAAEIVHAWENDTPALYNQLAAQWADHTLLPMNHALIVTPLLAPLAPLVVGPFTDAVIEVVARSIPGGNSEQIRAELTAGVEYAFARVIGPLVSAIGATGATHAKVFEAGTRGDSVAHALALLMTPVDVVNGFLFGGYGDISPLITGEVGGPRIPAPGLLTPWGQWPTDRSVIEDSPATTLAQKSVAAEGDAAEVDAAVLTRDGDAPLKATATEEAGEGTEAAGTVEVTEAAVTTGVTEAAVTTEGTEAAVTTDETPRAAWSWSRDVLSPATDATRTISLDVRTLRERVTKSVVGETAAADSATDAASDGTDAKDEAGAAAPKQDSTEKTTTSARPVAPSKSERAAASEKSETSSTSDKPSRSGKSEKSEKSATSATSTD